MQRLGPNFHICCLCSGSWGLLLACAVVQHGRWTLWVDTHGGSTSQACIYVHVNDQPIHWLIWQQALWKVLGAFCPHPKAWSSVSYNCTTITNEKKNYSHSFSLKKTDFLKSQIPTFQWTVVEDKECALFLNRCKNNNNKRSSAFQANLTIFKPGSWFFSCFTMTMPSLCCQTAKKAHSVLPKYQRNEQNQIGLHSSDGVYVSCSDAVP